MIGALLERGKTRAKRAHGKAATFDNPGGPCRFESVLLLGRAGSARDGAERKALLRASRSPVLPQLADWTKTTNDGLAPEERRSQFADRGRHRVETVSLRN